MSSRPSLDAKAVATSIMQKGKRKNPNCFGFRFPFPGEMLY
nr:unnamed protein product [Callosobruchus analis]